MPLPRHVLEDAYGQNKVAFQGLPYWNQEFVGTGPFKVRDFVPGSQVSMVANHEYVFGRPKLDEIEVRFMLGRSPWTISWRREVGRGPPER